VLSFVEPYGQRRDNIYLAEARTTSQTHSHPGQNEHSFTGVGQGSYHSGSLPLDTRRDNIQNPFMGDNSYLDLKTLYETRKEERTDAVISLPPIRPNRRQGMDVELGGVDAVADSDSIVTRGSSVNPLIRGFRSPIGKCFILPKLLRLISFKISIPLLNQIETSPQDIPSERNDTDAFHAFHLSSVEDNV